jgi:putative two-component system response regulator
MHDIGKIGILDGILLKPGALTPEELSIMRTHAQIGFDLLDGSESTILQAAALIALTHHEKFDGSGYPRALRGEEIPLFGRIVAVADVFDALTSVRPYKRAWTVEQAQAYLRDGAGGHFDPRCVSAFLHPWAEVQTIYDRHRDDHTPRI